MPLPMRFIMFLYSHPGKNKEIMNLIRRLRVPEGIRIVKAYMLFGKPDAMVEIDAADERTVADFAMQFDQICEVSTHLAMEIR